MADAEARRRDRLKAGAKRFMRVPLAVRTSDLPKRAGSAAVMVALAGAALWAGGIVWAAFVVLAGLGVFYEWGRLAFHIARRPFARAAWLAGGAAYIGFAALMLVRLRGYEEFGVDAGLFYVPLLLGMVISVDVGAYFAGRIIGGPKIAPRISPSKTWAGLAGGALAATVFGTVYYVADGFWWGTVLRYTLIAGPLCAIVAQAGDFFESWMKRQAGVKDSSGLIPGHGGVFDRVDGLLALTVAVGLIW